MLFSKRSLSRQNTATWHTRYELILKDDWDSFLVRDFVKPDTIHQHKKSDLLANYTPAQIHAYYYLQSGLISKAFDALKETPRAPLNEATEEKLRALHPARTYAFEYDPALKVWN